MRYNLQPSHAARRLQWGWVGGSRVWATPVFYLSRQYIEMGRMKGSKRWHQAGAFVRKTRYSSALENAVNHVQNRTMPRAYLFLSWSPLVLHFCCVRIIPTLTLRPVCPRYRKLEVSEFVYNVLFFFCTQWLYRGAQTCTQLKYSAEITVDKKE